MNIAESSVRFPITVIVRVLLVIVFGYVCSTFLPVELKPDTQQPTLVIATTFPGAAPDRAVPAFWENVLVLLLVAVAAAISSRLGSNRATLRRALAGVPGLLALVLGLLLIDAATPFSPPGGELKPSFTWPQTTM